MSFIFLNVCLFVLIGYTFRKFFISFNVKSFLESSKGISLNIIVGMITGFSFITWTMSLFHSPLEHHSAKDFLVLLPVQFLSRVFEPLFGELASSLASSSLVIAGLVFLIYRISRK